MSRRQGSGGARSQAPGEPAKLDPIEALRYE